VGARSGGVVEQPGAAGAGRHRGAIEVGRGILGRMLLRPRSVRIEDFDEVGGIVAALMRELGIRVAAAGPILRPRRWRP
jgi:hypothetical protein